MFFTVRFMQEALHFVRIGLFISLFGYCLLVHLCCPTGDQTHDRFIT